jgi:hypothetical protein
LSDLAFNQVTVDLDYPRNLRLDAVSLSGTFSLAASIPFQLLKRCFGKLIEEIDQRKNEESGGSESGQTIFTME